MDIVIDSREQKPLEFDNKHIDNVIIKKLDIGDYAADFKDGYRPAVVFERKSLGDLYGTMTSGYDRFKKEMARAKESGIIMFIIVECPLSKVLAGYKYSKFKGVSMGYKLFTMWVRHGVQTVFVKNRSEMAEYITQMYIAIGKEYVRNKKNIK